MHFQPGDSSLGWEKEGLLNTMIQTILALDRKLFLLINTGMANPVLDFAFPHMTQLKFWLLPLAVILALYYRREGKKGLLVLLLGMILIGITDPLCVRVLKPLFGRHRPCDPDFLVEGGRFLMGNLKSLSFPSAHAVNLFGLSAFFSLLYGRYWLIFFCSAGIISFTRVYVGVHYPLDVFTGAGTGLTLGYLYGKAALWLLSRLKIPAYEDTQGNRPSQ